MYQMSDSQDHLNSSSGLIHHTSSLLINEATPADGPVSTANADRLEMVTAPVEPATEEIRGLNVTTEQAIKPRSQCSGGSGQLKLGHKTKPALTEKERRERAMDRIKSKVGEEIAEDLHNKWKQVQRDTNKVKRAHEGDGIIRTLKSLGFSDLELRAFLNVGSSRIARVVANKPKPPTKPPNHAATDDDTCRVVDFILSLDLEPGYPCAHRSIPLYVEGDNQGSTWSSLHAVYKEKCEAANVFVFSYNRFREYVHHFFPTLKLGKTKTDMCNECFKLKLKLNDPETTELERLELKERLETHIGESSIQRRAINAYIQFVKDSLAPNDAPLRSDPCRFDEINDDVLQEALELNKINPVLKYSIDDMAVDVCDELELENINEDETEDIQIHQKSCEIETNNKKDDETAGIGINVEETSGESHDHENNNIGGFILVTDTRVVKEFNKGEVEDEAADDTSGSFAPEAGGNKDSGAISKTLKLSQKAKDSLKADLKKRTVDQRSKFAKTISKEVSQKMIVTIEDYGSEKPLPHYGLNRPNADYFNSSIHLRNMNIVNVSQGLSSIFIYDERSGGKDGNSVCSVRWEALKLKFQKHLLNKTEPPVHHVGIYDNCCGQNKSNTVFKFELLQTILGFYKTKNKLFLLPGHSHNSSDVKTAELNQCLRRKNLYTPQELCRELQAVKNAELFILEGDAFYDWEVLLNKYIKNMPPGFTSYYCFEISDGKVIMKKLCTTTPESETVSKVLVENVAAVRTAVLEELFDLPDDASLEDVIKAPLKLPRFKVKEISDKRLKSIKKKYSVIPREHLWYYPEGDQFLLQGDNGDEANTKDADDNSVIFDKPKKKVGRPKAMKPAPKTPSILSFFKALPSIPQAAVHIVPVSNPQQVRSCFEGTEDALIDCTNDDENEMEAVQFEASKKKVGAIRKHVKSSLGNRHILIDGPEDDENEFEAVQFVAPKKKENVMLGVPKKNAAAEQLLAPKKKDLDKEWDDIYDEILNE